MVDPFVAKIFGPAFFQNGCDHAVSWGFRSSLFSKRLRASNFFKMVVITPTTSLLEFSVKPFQKRLAVKVIKYI